ncbi:MAG: M3 family metallopeptidase [Hyphomicrobium sp.]
MAPTPKAKSKKPAAVRNPLLTRWSTPFAIAPFARIAPDNFRPAFKQALSEHRDEVKAISQRTARPTFANTVIALEKSGRLLNRVAEVFFNLASADTNQALQEIERELAPRLADHRTAILLDARLFKRIDDLHARRDTLKLTDEERRVLERAHLGFVRAGAKLGANAKKRVAEINGRLATLVTSFNQNVLTDEQSWRLVLEAKRDLEGLPPSLVAAAARTAEDLGLPGRHVITLARSSVEPFLQFSARRDLREEAFKAWISRGENAGASDNRSIGAEIITLRAELARIMGFDTFADYSLHDTMAKTPAAVRDLLGQVWQPALKRAAEEKQALETQARAGGGNFKLAAWDWRYYAEKVRRERYELDEAELRPYLALDQMIAAAFDTASRLFGLSFTERHDVPRYHPDVRVWEVKDKSGEHVGLFLGDYFARPSKRSGAWMSSYRTQHKLGRGARPIIVNVMSFARGAEGEPCLLSFDEASTLFHEFGHGLHGLLSDVTFPSIAGTDVSRDFVELPSQLYEHWLAQPQVLQRFALHAKTGKPMPEKLIKRLKAAKTFNQGFATVEFAASALVDMELHALPAGKEIDVSTFERETLRKLGMPAEIVMRHRIPHFMHIMGGYAAGYYSYLWSEVMDADAFAAFEEAGDIFHPETAGRLHEFIYSAGNRRDPLEAYVAFRGRPPRIEGLMKKRGFA